MIRLSRDKIEIMIYEFLKGYKCKFNLLRIFRTEYVGNIKRGLKFMLRRKDNRIDMHESK
jgi:hypothetical protein